MGAFEKFNARGRFDEAEPLFTDVELERAINLRLRVSPDTDVCHKLGRFDRCPHQPKCERLSDCIEAIAWYLRHQHVIEGRAK